MYFELLSQSGTTPRQAENRMPKAIQGGQGVHVCVCTHVCMCMCVGMHLCTCACACVYAHMCVFPAWFLLLVTFVPSAPQRWLYYGNDFLILV